MSGTGRRLRPVQEPGYTLIEVLVTVALLAVLAVILLPVLARGRAADRVSQAELELKAITDAADAFADHVLEWPSSLTQLVTPLAAGEVDICGATYSNGERNRWAGPYLSRPAAAGGVPAGVGMVAPTFTRAPAGDIDFLVLTVGEVEEGDVLALDARVDGDADPGAGTVRWSAAGSGQVILTWMVPIHAC